MSFNFEKWFSLIIEKNTVLSYQGEITEAIVNQTLESSENLMGEKGVDRKKIKKAYNIIVEGVQNLYHHSVPNPNEDSNDKFGAFSIGIVEDQVVIIFGNYIKSESVGGLKARMDQVNALGKEELKLLYKKTLSNCQFSEKGGGGLGMIDIAKRTGAKLNYSFFECDEIYSFYELKVNI